MLDKPASQPEAGISSRPRLDLQQHLADLEAAGLLVRIDRPINKDTELNPLVRWQFIGGVPEDQRRAFLFTNVIDSKGKRYDMPVVVGALASSPEIYAMGMGLPVEEIGDAWMRAIAQSDPAGRGERRAVPGGGDRRRRAARAGWRPQGSAGAGVDAGLRCRALSHRDAVRHQGSRQRRAQHGHLPSRVEGERPPGGAHGGARGDRRRRLSALAEVSRARREDADRHRGRLRADRDVHRAAEARDRHGRDGGGRRGGRRADPHGALPHHRSRRAGGFRDRGRGPDRHRRAGAGGAVRREQRLCRARRLQHADAGDRDHHEDASRCSRRSSAR